MAEQERKQPRKRRSEEEPEVVESDEAALTLRPLDVLGSLAIKVNGDQAVLVLHLAEDLPDNVRDQLFDVTG